MLTSSRIKDKARDLGFDLCGVSPVGDFPELAFFPRWVERGFAADMEYLGRSASRRADVRNVLPSAQSVIVTGTLYNVDRPYSTECADPGRAQIARYAWGDDYHDVIERRLDALVAWMREAAGGPFDARRYVDTGPVQERVYAQRAGIGWIGKNTCLINPQIGSWVFLGEIVCSLPLEPDRKAFDQCGDCTLCLEACPTGAIVEAGVLDSARCISYLTIERRGPLPDELAPLIGSHVYGCDVCQEVCPWNAHAPASDDPVWRPRPCWDAPRIAELARMSDQEMTHAMRGSSMRRAKPAGLRRNVAIALQNSQDASHAETADRRR